MARSTYIYILCPVGSTVPIAAFTVKYESQMWAERSVLGTEKLERFRMRDNDTNEKIVVPMVPCPWEES